MNRTIAAISLVILAVVGLTGCAADNSSAASDSIVIDVRTPEEFAAGHLDGALNIDVSADSFDSEVTRLATDESYVLYCRTGNRAAAALERMKNLGFTTLSNAGSLEEAAESTGLAIVTDP